MPERAQARETSSKAVKDNTTGSQAVLDEQPTRSTSLSNQEAATEPGRAENSPASRPSNVEEFKPRADLLGTQAREETANQPGRVQEPGERYPAADAVKQPINSISSFLRLEHTIDQPNLPDDSIAARQAALDQQSGSSAMSNHFQNQTSAEPRTTAAGLAGPTWAHNDGTHGDMTGQYRPRQTMLARQSREATPEPTGSRQNSQSPSRDQLSGERPLLTPEERESVRRDLDKACNTREAVISQQIALGVHRKDFDEAMQKWEEEEQEGTQEDL